MSENCEMRKPTKSIWTKKKKNEFEFYVHMVAMIGVTVATAYHVVKPHIYEKPINIR